MSLQGLLLDIPVIGGTVVIPPNAAPTALQANPASATQTNLAWVNKATNADNVNVYRRAQGSSTWTLVTTLAASATTYNDTGVTPGVATDHQVRAIKGTIEVGSNIVGSNTIARSITFLAYLSEWSPGTGLVPRYDRLGVVTPLTDHANTPSGAVGVQTGAIFHSASSQYLSAANNAAVQVGTSDFTVEGVFYLATKAAAQVLVSRWDSGGKFELRVRYAQSTDRMIFDVSSDGTIVTSITASTFGSPTVNTVYRFVCVRDKTNSLIKIAVGPMGVAPTIESAAYAGAGVNTTSLLLLGASNSGSPQFFMDGGLRSVTIHKVAFTSAEITALFVAGDIEHPYATIYEPSYDTSVFPTQTGSKVFYGGQQFIPVGVNCYPVGMCTTNFPAGLSDWQCDDLMKQAKNMGANTIRLWAGGFSSPTSLYPTLNGAYNETSFVQMDKALHLAESYGFKVILALVNANATVGMGDILGGFWGSASFYSNSTAIANYLAYVDTILNRVSTIDGIAYKNKPVFLFIETGNEVSPTGTWTTQVAARIKATAPNLLVLDGKNNGIDAASLTDANIAAVTTHRYPIVVSTLDTLLNTANLNLKFLLVGEYGWSGTRGGDDFLDYFLADLNGKLQVGGNLLWMLTPHDDVNGGWRTEFGGVGANGFAMMFGDKTAIIIGGTQFGGQYTTYQAMIKAIRKQHYRRRLVTTPLYNTPETPLILAHNNSAHTVTIRGAAAAETYNLLSGSDGVNFTTLATGLSDVSTGVLTNAGLTPGVWVSVVGVNPDGVLGSPSLAVQM